MPPTPPPAHRHSSSSPARSYAHSTVAHPDDVRKYVLNQLCNTLCNSFVIVFELGTGKDSLAPPSPSKASFGHIHGHHHTVVP